MKSAFKTLPRVGGKFRIEHYRKGKLIGTHNFPNGVTDEGIEYLLDAMFNSGSTSANWYISFINNSGYTGVDPTDVMSSHAGWTELTSYDEAARPEWAPDAASSRKVTNSSTVDFSINATVSIKGIFVCNDSTKSGTSGELWATALAASVISAVNGDTLKITYTVGG